MDKLKLAKIYDKSADFPKSYSDYTNYKNLVFTTPLRIVNGIITIAFLVALLTINNVYNLFFITVFLIISFIDKFLISRIIKFKRLALEEKENKILHLKGEKRNDVIDGLNDLSRGVSSYVSLLSYRKYILGFCALISAFTLMAVSATISINFLIFHFFLYYFLLSHLIEVFNIDESILKLRYYRVKIASE